MNKLITLAFVLLAQLSNAQKSSYWILLKDKGINAYSLTQPEQFLSGKAIERRIRQQIPITATDIPVNTDYILQIKKAGVQVLNYSRWFNTVSIVCSDESLIDAVKALPFVKEIREINTSSKANPVLKWETDETELSSQAAMQNKNDRALDYGRSYKQANQIGVTCMHDKGYLGQGVTIAVLDAGFVGADTLNAFDSLKINKQLLGTKDFVAGDSLVYESSTHGMMVLSCMVGNLPGKLIGTAPKASYWLFRTEDASSETLQEEMNWAVAAEYADSVGVDIINSSLGYNTFDDSTQNHTYADMDGNTTIITKAADIASGKGIVVTTSAGNSAGPPWFKITAPADADSVLTVGAVDSMGVIGGFSSRGPTYDGRIKPNTVARGVRAVVANTAGSISLVNGTSFSSPVTAGAVACLWQANKNKTNWELIQAIQKSASKYADPDSIMGYGIPDFCIANQLLTGVPKYNASDKSFSVYPNPFHDNFVIAYSSDTEEQIAIELRDVTGRILQSRTQKVSAGNEIKLEFKQQEELSDGIYIISITTSDCIFYKKLIKE